MNFKLHRLIIAITFICCLLFAGCDDGLRITKIEPGKPPNKIIYVAGVDKELDLTGATILIHLKQGDICEYDIYDESEVEITYNINFNKPGVYEVKVSRGEYHKFLIFIQVIDKSFLDAYTQDS